MRASLFLPVVLALIASPAASQVNGLNDLMGARAAGAEQEMLRRGYVNTGGSKGDDRSYTNWWNADRRQCVTVATMTGRYSSIMATPAPDCRQEGSIVSRPDWRPRPHGPSMGSIHQTDLSRFCKGEAAAAFDRRPSEITTNLPIRQRSGTIVQGWLEEGRTRFFTCRFSPDGRFLSVN